MMSDGDTPESLGHLLHGTARAWRQKLDERLKPMGLSQAKWRTLMHLSIAQEALTQAEIAARLGVEEPTVVTLLHRLEREAWITRTNSPALRIRGFLSGRTCFSSFWQRLSLTGSFNTGPPKLKPLRRRRAR